MHDYLRALYGSFYRFQNSDAETEKAKQALKQTLDDSQRRLLLALTDAEDALRDESALGAFIAGFRVADGIARELHGGWFSFAAAESERAKHPEITK